MGLRSPRRHPLSVDSRANSLGKSSSRPQDFRHCLHSLQLNSLVLLDAPDQSPRPRHHSTSGKSTEQKCPEHQRQVRHQPAHGQVLLLYPRWEKTRPRRFKRVKLLKLQHKIKRCCLLMSGAKLCKKSDLLQVLLPSLSAKSNFRQDSYVFSLWRALRLPNVRKGSRPRRKKNDRQTEQGRPRPKIKRPERRTSKADWVPRQICDYFLV